LIAASTDNVGFLDAPNLAPAALSVAIRKAFSALSTEAVLTVYNDHPGGSDAVDELCQESEVDLVGVIRHPKGGTTFTLRERH
jgi:hypothetical protein